MENFFKRILLILCLVFLPLVTSAAVPYVPPRLADTDRIYSQLCAVDDNYLADTFSYICKTIGPDSRFSFSDIDSRMVDNVQRTDIYYTRFPSVVYADSFGHVHRKLFESRDPIERLYTLNLEHPCNHIASFNTSCVVRPGCPRLEDIPYKDFVLCVVRVSSLRYRRNSALNTGRHVYYQTLVGDRVFSMPYSPRAFSLSGLQDLPFVVDEYGVSITFSSIYYYHKFFKFLVYPFTDKKILLVSL